MCINCCFSFSHQNIVIKTFCGFRRISVLGSNEVILQYVGLYLSVTAKDKIKILNRIDVLQIATNIIINQAFMDVLRLQRRPEWLVRPQFEHRQKRSEAVRRTEHGYIPVFCFYFNIPYHFIEKTYYCIIPSLRSEGEMLCQLLVSLFQ